MAIGNKIRYSIQRFEVLQMKVTVLMILSVPVSAAVNFAHLRSVSIFGSFVFIRFAGLIEVNEIVLISNTIYQLKNARDDSSFSTRRTARAVQLFASNETASRKLYQGLR